MKRCDYYLRALTFDKRYKKVLTNILMKILSATMANFMKLFFALSLTNGKNKLERLSKEPLLRGKAQYR